MKNKEGTVIYVGKAKKLKNRVSSYFVGAHNYKTTKLVQEIVDFDYIVTDSEKEALLLEINLIKDYSPKYNISFMDNKYYPYIQLTKEKHPRLKIVRNAQDKKHKHFGPFPDGTAARETFKLLNRLYPLRKCNHIPKKPCLYYSLNQCVAPCIQEVSDEVYKEMTSSITKFIQGDTKEIINDLQNKMMSASEVQNYELAKECRDLITHIQHVTSKQHVQFNDLVDRDIVGYYSDKGYLCLQLFFMRNGKLLARDLNLVPAQDDYQEQIISFLVQFYQENTEPKELLVPQELDIELLKEIVNIRYLLYRCQYAEMVECFLQISEVCMTWAKNSKTIMNGISNIIIDFCEKHDSELHYVPLDVWLSIGGVKFTNTFTIFDKIKPAVLNAESFYVIQESKLISKRKYIRDAEDYIQCRGEEAKTIKKWLAELKQVTKRRRADERYLASDSPASSSIVDKGLSLFSKLTQGSDESSNSTNSGSDGQDKKGKIRGFFGRK